jgi:hypothetical protein
VIIDEREKGLRSVHWEYSAKLDGKPYPVGFVNSVGEQKGVDVAGVQGGAEPSS